MTPTTAAVLAAMLSTLCLTIDTAEILKDITGNVELQYIKSNNGMDVQIFRNGTLQLSGKLGIGKNLEEISCIGEDVCIFGNNEQILVKPIENGFNITWVVEDPSEAYEDCYDLNSKNIHWYGGPESSEQVWPLEKMTINGNEPYIIKMTNHFAVAEMYWLSCKGTYIVLNETTPLWVDQNQKNNDQVCFKAKAVNPYINRWRVVLSYTLVSLDDSKIAHLDAINKYLGKPKAYPDEKIIAEPIWTTWAKYKKQINDNVVLQYANEIRSHGYTGGQLEIDDVWETCYGSQEFNTKQFGDIKNTIASLHKDNWKVSLWVHPFVNDDCQNNSRDGKSLDYFVKNTTGNVNASWWNGHDAHQIDFTKPDAVEWWSARLRKLQDNPGIDSFKFDGGESNYANEPNVFEDIEHTPNILTQKYVEACAEFGDRIEYRASFRNQQYGKLLRMLDKSSTWGINNGLASLITNLLQFNMNGYGMVLPDMIGGNGYRDVYPTAELYVRWTQANTFMPTMQFSYLPWDFKAEVSYDVEAIVKKYVDLHTQYAPNIIKIMKKSIANGDPVNPPIWWVDAADSIALGSDDEYLLGEEVLVAPVIVEGALSRDVYLPKGQWKDGNNGTVYTGPVTLKDYPAPIEVLPYFIQQ